MRSGMTTILGLGTLGLALCLAGCGQAADPAPAASETPAAPSPAPASSPAPGPSESAGPAAVVAPPAPAKAPMPKLAIPIRFRALGTEPFWGAQISGEMLTYTTPDDSKGQHAALTRRDQTNGAEFSGKLGGSAIHLAVTRAACSDGMSDRSYPFTVVLTLGSERREGCAL